MSKSLGNVVNPLHVIEGIDLEDLIKNLAEAHLDEKEMNTATQGMKASYPNGIPQLGADAMRMALISFAGMSRTANLNVNVIVSYRNFCNKIWNAIRFAMPNFENFKGVEFGTLSVADKWVLNKLSNAVKAAIAGCQDFLMSDAISTMIHFFHDEFCSVYLEAIKPIMSGKDEEKKKTVVSVLYEVIETSLRMLHPFMPFVTEDLWQRLPKRFDVPSIMLAPYPQVNEEWINFPTESMDTAILISQGARRIKQTYNLKSNTMKMQIITDLPNIADTFDSVHALAAIGEITTQPFGTPITPGFSSEVVSDTIEVRLDLTGLIDFEKELKNTQAKKAKILVNFNKLETKVSQPTYTTKVPQNVQETEKGLLETYRSQIKALEAVEENLKKAIEAK
ncbi:Valyl tRNA Synthetase [Tritrichomonas foetus]|uniref:valine--tRNA ligase n=1 Tax=Tritrichomonas foetus TaxID=1144522 RepID=A0A1J4KDJ8_9EUKA|nr:Valyl tRNA Synthetase [Tritrichomonas foetus]|eukprot:OHT07533.1 Valyl tRNA Synthetase [Tritrichomonas foetus]